LYHLTFKTVHLTPAIKIDGEDPNTHKYFCFLFKIIFLKIMDGRDMLRL